MSQLNIVLRRSAAMLKPSPKSSGTSAENHKCVPFSCQQFQLALHILVTIQKSVVWEALTVQHSQNNNIHQYHRSGNLQSKCYVCSKPHAQSQIPIIRTQAARRIGKIFVTTEMTPDDLDLQGASWMCHNFL